jgi:hypothetical protein
MPNRKTPACQAWRTSAGGCFRIQTTPTCQAWRTSAEDISELRQDAHLSGLADTSRKTFRKSPRCCPVLAQSNAKVSGKANFESDQF